MTRPTQPLFPRSSRILLLALLASTAWSCGSEPAPSTEPSPDRDAGNPNDDADASEAGRDDGGVAPSDAGSDAAAPGPVPITANVSGLSGQGLVLRTSAGEEITVATDGSLSFAKPVDKLDLAALTVVSHPTSPKQTCSVGLDAGKLKVSCATNTYAVGGSAVDLAGSGLVLRGSWGESLAVTQSGGFQFAQPQPDLAAYTISVETQPGHPKQVCALQASAGSIAGAEARDLKVSCTTERFRIGGEVHGLLGSGLQVELEGGESLAVTKDGSIQFPTSVKDGQTYKVKIKTQPQSPTQRCVVARGEGTLDGANVTNVSVVCGAMGGLRITEVGSCYFANSACWLEIYNAGSTVDELSYYQLRTSALPRKSPFTYQPEHVFALPTASVAPGAYLVLQAQSSAALPSGDRVVHVYDADDGLLPWWNGSGFAELITAEQTVDFVRFGESPAQPRTASGWTGAAAVALPSGEASYGYGLARNKANADADKASDWVVRAFATPGGENDVTSDADVDADGVPDSAEVQGGTFAGMDLFAMGARVGTRDLFIEVDRMQSVNPAVTPQREALDLVVAAFAKRNIAVHFDVGTLYSAVFSPQLHNLGGGNVVPFAQGIGIGVDTSSGAIADIYDYKAVHMRAARRSLFYYMLFGWSQKADGTAGSSGIGERPGNDSIITLGGFNLDVSTEARRNLLINYQAATIMHELGHNLGLRHGGGDDLNGKPNYFSVMNYLYSPVGLSTIGDDEGDRYDYSIRCTVFNLSNLTHSPAGSPSQFVIDYSNGSGADIDESSIVEAEGLGRLQSSSVDFNCNGKVDAAPYADDLNADNVKNVLVDYDDWASLAFVFRRWFVGSENGPSLVRAKATVHEDQLTHDVQTIVAEPCPTIAISH